MENSSRKTKPILYSEIFKIIRGRDHGIFTKTLIDNFPKVRRYLDKLDKLSIDELERFIELLKEAYDTKVEPKEWKQIQLDIPEPSKSQSE